MRRLILVVAIAGCRSALGIPGDITERGNLVGGTAEGTRARAIRCCSSIPTCRR